MPVEVRELIIKAVVDDQLSGGEQKKEPGTSDKDEIISECVEQVVEILKKEKER